MNIFIKGLVENTPDLLSILDEECKDMLQLFVNTDSFQSSGSSVTIRDVFKSVMPSTSKR